MKKVLFVGAGKRLTMANFFINLGSSVDSYELDINVPISLVCENILKGYRWDNSEVYEHLVKIIKEGNYDLVIPFQCAAVEVLANIREKESINSICVSDISTSEICLKKDEFEKHFVMNKNLVDMYPQPVTAPFVLKPSRGNASRGIKYCKEMPKTIPNNYIVQKQIKGTEYSVDCYFNIYGELIDYIPRIREEITGGEVTRSITTKKDVFEKDQTIQRISKEFKFRGPICMQFIVDKNGRPWIIEINCRFGGGATLSISSGLNMPQYLLDEYVSKISDFSKYNSVWKEGVRLVRCFRDYCYEENSI